MILSATKLELHPKAETAISELVRDYKTAIVRKAEGIAIGEGADVIMSPHVREAARRNSMAHIWDRSWMAVISGSLLGACVSGVLGQMNFLAPQLMLALYIICG